MATPGLLCVHEDVPSVRFMVAPLALAEVTVIVTPAVASV